MLAGVAANPADLPQGGRRRVAQVRQATEGDWDALDLLLTVDGYLLTDRRNSVAARLYAAGLPCDLPTVR